MSSEKILDRVISNRFIWKLEVAGGKANKQFAYRKQKSCVQTMLSVCNSISEARSRKEYTVVRKLLREDMEGWLVCLRKHVVRE